MTEPPTPAPGSDHGGAEDDAVDVVVDAAQVEVEAAAQVEVAGGGAVLGPDFYDRPVQEVARDLLGCVLRHGEVAVRLTEVEAYAGLDDPGSHAFRGPTPRTQVMFGPPGRLYVYFSYGMHHCVNVVCGPDGTASAVLLRAGEVVDGVEEARRRRTRPGRPAPPDRDLARGPARLTVALGLDRSHDGLDTTAAGAEVVLTRETSANDLPTEQISAGPRVGVSGPGGGPEYPWRYHLAHPSVSAYRAAVPRRRRTAGKLDPGHPRATAADRPKG